MKYGLNSLIIIVVQLRANMKSCCLSKKKGKKIIIIIRGEARIIPSYCEKANMKSKNGKRASMQSRHTNNHAIMYIGSDMHKYTNMCTPLDINGKVLLPQPPSV